MSHRPIGVLAATAVALCCLAVPASASKMAGFRLANTTAVPVSEVFFELLPEGTVTPPIIGNAEDGSAIEGSPLRALDTSTGVDTDSAFVLLADDPNAPDMERLFLLFGYRPSTDPSASALPFDPLFDEDGNRVGELSPGGVFDFELSLADAFDPSTLASGVDGLSLSLLNLPPTDPDPPTGNPDPSDGGNPGAQVPEPSALLLWAVPLVLGLALARRRRRAARALAAA